MEVAYSRAYAGQGTTDKKLRVEVARHLGEVNGATIGGIEDLRDGYSLLRDLYAQAWLRSNRAYALRPVLEHYDYTVGLWLARADKVRSAAAAVERRAHAAGGGGAWDSGASRGSALALCHFRVARAC